MARPRRRTAAFRAVVAASCAVLVLSACANDDDDNEAVSTPAATASASATPEPTPSASEADVEALTTLTVEILTTDDLKRKCEELATSGFVLAVFGGQESCQEEDDDSDDDNDPTGAELSDVVVTGDSASAVVAIKGGSTDGAEGAWRFTKDATGWRLSEWSIDYLRSVLATGFGTNYQEGEGGPIDDPDVRSCFVAKLQSLDDQNFRTTMYTLIAGRDDADQYIGETLIACGYEEDGGSSGSGSETASPSGT
ncbi:MULTISPECIES: hypothetical protein [Sporichthya]|uniref:Lipoprotein n=1 Tax=Sporichthya brevicatena TaxID=171442 RepID=A0ABN1G2S9_9ACTN|nr:hypothetical protein [Sporichthya polymorpha]